MRKEKILVVTLTMQMDNLGTTRLMGMNMKMQMVMRKKMLMDRNKRMLMEENMILMVTSMASIAPGYRWGRSVGEEKW